MWAVHPTSNVTPLLVVEGCGRTQNVEAGTQGEHETRTTGLSPSFTATTNTKHPRKDRQDAYATERGHERERQQNRKSGVDACPTTSPLPLSRDAGVYTIDELVKKDGKANTRRQGYPRRLDSGESCIPTPPC